MTQAATAPARKTLTTRLGTSPKTLHRKAMQQAAATPMPDGEGLEDIFPPALVAQDAESPAVTAAPAVPATDASQPDPVLATADEGTAPAADTIGSSAAPAQADEPSAAPPSTVVEDRRAPVAPVATAIAPAWSAEDERAFQTLAERRRAAGFRLRGRDVSAQRLCLGKIIPNERTVMATIAGIVAAAGVVGRDELLDLIAGTTFASPKAKPTDRHWAQAYVAGALRIGALAVADDSSTSGGLPAGSTLGERSPDVAA